VSSPSADDARPRSRQGKPPRLPGGGTDTGNILRHWREAVPKDRLAHLVRDCGRAFRRALELRLAAHGVPFGHWTFLRILWHGDGLTQKELSQRAGVMEPTTFAAMKAMEALGYVTRQQAPHNRKNVYIHLTDRGRALRNVLVPLAMDTNRISTQGIAAGDLATARQVLLAMIENLAQDEAGALPAAASRRVPQRREAGDPASS
jgi:MarR family transcriptional regulator, organic hydroperoxide resistance regulator